MLCYAMLWYAVMSYAILCCVGWAVMLSEPSKALSPSYTPLGDTYLIAVMYAARLNGYSRNACIYLITHSPMGRWVPDNHPSSSLEDKRWLLIVKSPLLVDEWRI